MRVLIADDDAGVRKALHHVIVAHQGWTVCGEAVDGCDAVEQAKHCQPELVVLDFAMPVMNGLGAATRISQMLPAVPIVMYTLYESPQLHVEAKKCGVTHVVSKADAELLIVALEAITEASLSKQDDATALPAAAEDDGSRQQRA